MSEIDRIKDEEIDDYVPDFFPGDNHGDYLMLTIDIETGQILNWKPPTIKELEDILNKNEE